jgi:hypothetical protein
MNWVGRKNLWAATVLAATQLLCGPLAAQTPGSPPASNSAGSAHIAVHIPVALQPPDLIPPIPVAKSPVAFFRELLAMNALERKQSLTNRSPENQKLILAKVREYAALDPDRREERLQVTELRWYLLPLMNAPATNREAQLATVPARNRKLVEDRLQEWDKLPSDVQKDLLANEATIRYFTEIEGLTDEQRRKILEGMSPARREKLQAGIEQWNRTPEAQRRKLISRFNQFFDLTAADKEKALRTLSGPERRQIEKTLKTFGNLPPDQRAKCVRAIEKYTSLSLEERQRFLKNAEHWRLLTPSQRQAWRDLVDKLPPPLPPDLPPLPPSHPPSRPAPAVATNGG